MIWLVLSAICAYLFWRAFIRPLNRYTSMGVQQTKPWPIVGDELPVFMGKESPGQNVLNIYNLHPNTRYVGCWIGGKPSIMLKDPELIKILTVKDFDNFTDHQFAINPDVQSDPLWKANLIALKGQKWRGMRATLSGSFTSSKMKHMFALINEVSEHFIEFFIEKNETATELSMKEVFSRYTNDVIATAAFGLKVDSLKEPDNSFYSMGRILTDFSSAATKIRFLFVALLPKIGKIFKMDRILNPGAAKYFQNVIHETIKVREEKHVTRKDMLNLLLEARKGIDNTEETTAETGFATVKEYSKLEKNNFKQLKYLTDDDIVSQALIFFFAGFDTISTALTFGSFELALNKDIQDRLRQEIMETHEATNGVLTYEALFNMKYMDMVFSEIVRKWPPVHTIDRVCTKPYTIEPVLPHEVPVKLDVGELLLLPMIGLHRNPKFYPNPDKFDPERFSDENKGKIVPYSYIPFGSGPRNCIGSRFAILEAKTMFYNLLLNFELVPTEKTIVPIQMKKGGQVMRVDGDWLAFKRINRK